MTEPQTEQQARWDRRYQSRQEAGEPCSVLADNLHLLSAGAHCLDLASGLGANALTLAGLGFTTEAWDISTVALQKLAQWAQIQRVALSTRVVDVEMQPPTAASFDVIVVSQFLHRPLFPALIAALRPQGLLFYQTFHQQKISGAGPSSADYLLAPGELLTLTAPLRPLFYREDGRTGDQHQGRRDCAYLVAIKEPTDAA
jgi:tellurite methyltransferase